MDLCVVLSLQHLSCSKIVASLLNKAFPTISSLYSEFLKTQRPRLRELTDQEFEQIKSEVTKDIAKLIPCVSLQKKLESFITPLFCEIEEWLKTCYRILPMNDNTFFVIMDNIPQCWLTDGTIDREKSAKLVVQNTDLLSTNRFIFACTYCLYEDVLNLWKRLSDREKYDLRHLQESAQVPYDLDFLVRQWIDWLESWLNKDWPFCVAWILGTSLWSRNMCVLKSVLLALTPVERSHYLLKCLIGRPVNSDVMRFCLSIMTRDEQELICRESPVEVFRCISSWPLRSAFFDVVNSLWPYLTNDTFNKVLETISEQIIDMYTRSPIKKWNRDSVQLVEMLQNFWTSRPHRFRTISQDDPALSIPLRFVLNYDFKRDCFSGKLCWHVMSQYQRNNAEFSTIMLNRRTIMMERVLRSRRLNFRERFMKFFRELLGLRQLPEFEEEQNKQTIIYCSCDSLRVDIYEPGF